MKTRVNLYHQQYQPKVNLLSLNSTAFTNLVVLVLILSLYVGLSWRQVSLNEQNRLLSGRAAELQSRIEQLKSELESQKPSPVLMASIEQQKTSISQRQRLLQELSNRERGKQNRFSVVLSDLERADTPYVWLTRIHMQEEQVSIAGYGSTPDAMPKWLANLSGTASFKGMAFEQASMQRDDNAIAFELNTQLSEQLNNAGEQ